MNYLPFLSISCVSLAIATVGASLTLAQSPTTAPSTMMSPAASPMAPMHGTMASPKPAAATMSSAPMAELSTSLSPKSEVPATASKGTGMAIVNVFNGNKVCYRLTVSGLDTATAAHIHVGSAGKNGPVVLPLQTPDAKATVHCTIAKASLAQDMAKNPASYYVNVHTQKYGNGAIRGQLAVATSGSK